MAPDLKPAGGVSVRSPLYDAEMCGEDLAYNARRAAELVPLYCKGCAEYHLAQAAKRLSGRSWWSHGARAELIRILSSVLAPSLGNGHSPIDIVIAGAGETGVVSTCAHTAATVAGADLARTRFMVLDKCRTPLELCRDYGNANALDLHTRTADFMQPMEDHPADAIVLHSVLNFIPDEMQVQFLERLRGWLKPGGKIICWNSLAAAEGEKHRDEQRRREAAVAAGEILEAPAGSTFDPGAVAFSRLISDRPGAPREAAKAPLSALYRAAGLRIDQAEEVALVMPLADGRPFERKYSVVVAGI